MKFYVALAALLTAAPSSPVETGPGTRWFDGMPPAQYEGTGSAILILTDNVEQFCGKAPEGLRIMACVKRTEGGTPFIFMPNPRGHALAGEEFAQILFHEIAHVNGWSGEHPSE